MSGDKRKSKVNKKPGQATGKSVAAKRSLLPSNKRSEIFSLADQKVIEKILAEDHDLLLQLAH